MKFDPQTKSGIRCPSQRPEIDIGLAAMCLHRRDSDQTFSQTEIAEVCGVDRRTINWLERSAKHKLRKALYRAGVRSRFDHR